MRKAFCLLFGLVFVVCSSFAQAEERVEPEYVTPTIENLANLYWKLGTLDIESDRDIDSYLIITECQIYKDHRHNDVQWHEIRKVTRDMIQKNKDSFSNHFEIITKIGLGHYDLDRQVFYISEGDQILGQQSFEYNYNQEAVMCGGVYNLPGYPKDIVLELTRPIALTQIAMPPEDAENLIQEKYDWYESLHINDRPYHDPREVYLRLKIEVLSYDGVTQDKRKAIVKSHVNSLEVYSDKARENLIYKRDYNH